MRHITTLWRISSCRAASTLPKGPDRIIPTKNQYTWEPDGAVTIQRDSIKLLQDFDPISIPSLFRQQVENDPDHLAFVFKRDEIHKQWTFSQYLEDVEMAAKALIQIGLQPHHSVTIIGFNAPQYIISKVAAIFAGGTAAGVYLTSSPEMCHHTASMSRANVFIVEDDQQLQKVLHIKKDLAHLRAIVQYMGKPAVEGVLSWEEFLELGRHVPDSALKERQENMAINQAAVILFTSGTTGPPKGAMLSHDNIISGTELCRRSWAGLNDRHQSILSYLPLNHIAAIVADMVMPLLNANTLHFAKPDAFRGSLISSLKEVRPHRQFLVPRVLEKFHEFLLPKVPHGNLSEERRIELLQMLGLERCRDLFLGAAPPKQESVRFFHEVMKLSPRELFGLTECGVCSIPSSHTLKFGSVGKFMMPGMIHNPDSQGEGEIWLKGRTVFMGYLGEKEKTAETFEDGWLKTGDIGREEADGHVYITGRIKELIITAGGENVPPLAIENAIKSGLPVLSNCMVVGDNRKYLAALITLKTEKDAKTEELLDDLQPDVIEWCQSIGSNSTKLTDILNGPDLKVFEAIQKGLDRVNAAAQSRVQQVRKWHLLPKDFSLEGDELGPTLKLKRQVVHKKYASVIESMYED